MPMECAGFNPRNRRDSAAETQALGSWRVRAAI